MYCMRERDDLIGKVYENTAMIKATIIDPEKMEKIMSERIPEIEICLEDNEIWKSDNFVAKIIHVPGHTKGHICFHFFQKDTKRHFFFLCVHMRLTTSSLFVHAAIDGLRLHALLRVSLFLLRRR